MPALRGIAMKVYIVEDSAIVRERLIGLFAELNDLEIIGQAEGETEALSAIRQMQPDVVILDLQLAEGSGFELLRKMKQAAEAPLAVVLTGHALPQYRQRCLEVGADYFFDKTAEFEQCLEIFKQWLQRDANQE